MQSTATLAKHDRRKTSGQPPSSRPDDPGAAAGARRGQRCPGSVPLLHRAQVLEAMMEADREVLCGAKGRHQVERPAWRGGSSTAR